MSTVILKKDLIYSNSMKKTDNGKKENIAMRKAIEFFGGTVKLAKKLNYSNQSDISKWLYETRLIPIKHAVKIEELTKGKIKAKELRPDIKWLSSLNIKE
jgi:DNA-binding transcriptional regulator YdaS (Cro superfamily)